VIAAAGLAIGLAFQGTLSNFAAGVLLIIFRPFGVGDFVEVGGVSGAVEEVQIFTTVLRTPDNKKVILGNSSVTQSSITNYAAYATRRIDMVLGVSYGDDLRLARDVIARVLAQESRVLQEPAPVIGVAELAESSVNIVARPWVATADYWAVKFALTEAIKVAFDEAGLSIPFPQRDVHLQHVQAA
jgi:small conductance mechanosensitive channel